MSGILCPDCSGKTQVRDSRPSGENQTRQRRYCENCRWRGTTYEKIGVGQVENKLVDDYYRLDLKNRRLIRGIIHAMMKLANE